MNKRVVHKKTFMNTHIEDLSLSTSMVLTCLFKYMIIILLKHKKKQMNLWALSNLRMMGYLERQAKTLKQVLPCHSYPAMIFFSLLSSPSQILSHFLSPSLYKSPLTFPAWREILFSTRVTCGK